MSDFTFTSRRDGTEIHVHRWLPDGAPRALVQIAHGMGEHARRYASLAEALTGRGYAVYANDHRGHGRSILPGHEPGHMGDGDAFHDAVADVVTLAQQLRDQHDAPLALMGHSMGSFMVQATLSDHPGLVDAAILSATNGRPPPIAAAGRVIARIERRLRGKAGKSPIIDALSFKDFNRKFKPNRTDFDWISRDQAEVDAYIADPLCGFIASNQSWISMLDALPELTSAARLSRIPRSLPIYIFSGTSDAVGEMGAGVMRLVHAYADAGLQRVTVKLYPGGRHEMLHETNRDEVIADLIRWLDDTLAHAARSQAHAGGP